MKAISLEGYIIIALFIIGILFGKLIFAGALIIFGIGSILAFLNK